MRVTEMEVSVRVPSLLLAGLLALAPVAIGQGQEDLPVQLRPAVELPGVEPPAVEPPSGEPQAAAEGAGAPGGAVAYQQRIVRQGIVIDFEIEKVEPATGPTLREGDSVVFRFHITDTTSGSPLSSVYPGAWMDLKPESEKVNPEACKQKVEAFVGGSLLTPPELDLNVYYVLALNNDATISVVDPLFGFGTTKLLDMIFLESPGQDWALSPDQKRLFVSLPESGKIAVADTSTWEVATYLEVAPGPDRVALQPDGRYLWVGHRTPGEGEGPPALTVIDTAGPAVAAELPVGRGPHEIAFSDDDRFAFVTNRQDGTLSVFDVRRLEKVGDLEVGEEPVSVAFSAIGGAAWVANRGDGTLAVVDAGRMEVVARVEVEPGLGQLRFAPGGRFGLVVNPERDLVHVVDASVNRVVQTGEVEDEPDQVTFSDELAYVRHRGSETVLMIPLDGIGVEGTALPVVDFTGGQRPFGQGSRPSPADSIVQAPGATAVLVANPADKAIYFYKEGMAAPMGHFQNYSREPRAVLALDRSLREQAPGTYETTAALRSPGRYDVAFFLDAPRTIHCFEVDVGPNPELEVKRGRAQPLKVEYLTQETVVPVGEPMTVTFRLTDTVTGEPRSDLDDVRVLTFRAPGLHQQRLPAQSLGEGRYRIDFTPPDAGAYYLFVGVSSLGLAFQESPALVLRAGEGEPVAPGDGAPSSGSP